MCGETVAIDQLEVSVKFLKKFQNSQNSKNRKIIKISKYRLVIL